MYQLKSYHRGCLHHPSPTLEVREGEIMAQYGKAKSCSPDSPWRSYSGAIETVSERYTLKKRLTVTAQAIESSQPARISLGK